MRIRIKEILGRRAGTSIMEGYSQRLPSPLALGLKRQ
jgi:hypothetical protein